MGRRKRQSAARQSDRKSAEWTSAKGDRPATEEFLAEKPKRSGPHPRRPNKWFLAAAVLLQAAWIGFLLVMALAD